MLYSVFNPSIRITGLIHGYDSINVTMMKPEDGVKRRNLDNTHMTQSEDVVQTIVKCLEVPNLAR